VFESGAILIYLAEKTGRFLPASPRARINTLEWLMFQMGGLGPMLGQAHHFRAFAPQRVDYAIDRYSNEARRLYGVLDRRLASVEWLAGAEYTIADIASFPWCRSHERQGIDLAEFPNVSRWFAANENRPAVARGTAVLAERRKAQLDEQARKNLYGSEQYRQR